MLLDMPLFIYVRLSSNWIFGVAWLFAGMTKVKFQNSNPLPSMSTSASSCSLTIWRKTWSTYWTEAQVPPMRPQ